MFHLARASAGALALALVLFAASSAPAVPILYQQQLEPGIASAGVNVQTPGNQSNPVGATYFFFAANAGDNITVFGDRLAGHYDMSFHIFQGLYADTDDFGGSFPGLQGANFIAFGDDQDPPNIPGPFGDPSSAFVAPTTGFYTVAVTNFLSGVGGPPNPFQLTATGILPSPEPASMALFGAMAATALGYGWRRRRQPT